MKNQTLNDVAECRAFGNRLGDLLLAGIKGRTMDRDYRALLQEYDETPALRQVLAGILESLKAEVVSRDLAEGIVVSVTASDSPLVERIERTFSDHREMAAAVLATILALYYPPDALEDRTIVPRALSVRDVHDRIAQILPDMRREAEAAADDDGLAMWTYVDARMTIEEHAFGYAKGTVAWQILAIFRALERNKLVGEVRDAEGGVAYQPTRRLLILVENRVNHDLYIDVAKALAATRSARSVRSAE